MVLLPAFDPASLSVVVKLDEQVLSSLISVLSNLRFFEASNRE